MRNHNSRWFIQTGSAFFPMHRGYHLIQINTWVRGSQCFLSPNLAPNISALCFLAGVGQVPWIPGCTYKASSGCEFVALGSVGQVMPKWTLAACFMDTWLSRFGDGGQGSVAPRKAWRPQKMLDPCVLQDLFFNVMLDFMAR